MSKFTCDCGHVIVDQTDFLPYKAHFLADEDTRYLNDDLDILTGFVEAWGCGEDRQYIERLNGLLARLWPVGVDGGKW